MTVVVDTDLQLLRNQRVLVIGTGAMGRATADLCTAHGAHVIVAGRHVDRIEGNNSSWRAQAADLTDPEATSQLLTSLSPLDHIAVLAGGSGAAASSVVDTPLPVAQAAYERLWLSYNVLHHAESNVRPGGSITLLSGSSSRRPVAGLAVWGSLHGAIEALARNAVLELAPVRVNTISPGGIGMIQDRQLVDHAGEPRDVAAMAVAIMSNPAVTATVIDVDGGERLGAR